MPAFDSPEPILAIIDVATAHVRISASDRADTVVEIRPTDELSDTDVRAAEEIQVEYADGRLLVRAPREGAPSASDWGLSLDKLVESPSNWARSLLLGAGGSVDVRVDLPADSRIDAKTAASLRCRGALGEVSLTTSYGDIQVEEARRLRLKSTHGAISVSRATEHAEVTTTNGDIRIGTTAGTAVVRTSHGEIRLREVTGDLRLHSAHGDSVVDHALADVTVKTAYGSVRIDEMESGSVVMETTGGGLELGIRDGSAAWLDLSSKHGSVEVSLDPADDPADHPGQPHRVIEVRAHTTHGDIDIHRS